MNKLIAISLLIVFLCVNTELHQLLRLPVLIHHFLDHSNQEPEISFVEFLNEHYSSNQKHSDNSHKDHDKLPFKTLDCSNAHVALAFVNHSEFSIPTPTTFYDKISSSYYSVIYSSTVIRNIWQPPKIS